MTARRRLTAPDDPQARLDERASVPARQKAASGVAGRLAKRSQTRPVARTGRVRRPPANRPNGSLRNSSGSVRHHEFVSYGTNAGLRLAKHGDSPQRTPATRHTAEIINDTTE